MSNKSKQPGSRHWNQLVAEGAGALGVTVTGAQVETLAAHANELLKWNRKINLTRIVDPVEMALKHYVDSLACVPHIPAGARVLDIGSGGGFPGVPVAVVAQPAHVLMIDSVGKKISFVQHAIRMLRLSSAEARHVRVQALAEEPDYREAFDRVVCRALTGVDQIIELAFPLLKTGGMVVALKGREDRAQQECDRAGKEGESDPATGTHRILAYRLPVLNEKRSVILINK